jgi:ABC-type branched-subunit amino acid transport system permease subunit
MVLREISERQLPLLHTRFTIFPSGALTVPKPRFGPVDVSSPPTFLLFTTVVFALLGVGLIAFRHSNYGRRVAALRDSPAAAATLGMNVVRLKLLVFMLSAAIAGLGGALMSAQVGSVNIDRFDIFLSLALLMVTVVGGAGYVSGALFGGLLLGAGFVALDHTFAKLGTDHASLHSLFHFLSRFTTVMPALIGVTMGRNPNGAVHDVVTEYRAAARARPVVIGATALSVLLYALRRVEVINNWYLLVALLIVFCLVPVVAKRYSSRTAAADGAARGDEEDVPLELVGIARPFTDRDRTFLDEQIGLGGRRGNGPRTNASTGAMAVEPAP